MPQELQAILRETPELARAFLVGGCVRDSLLEIPVKDFDVEVHGVSYETLSAALSRWGRTDLVGRSFGVVKLTTSSGIDYDFTIPRRDSKTAPGHKGFEVTFDLGLDLKDAAARRDFTINAILYNPHTGEWIDCFHGLDDLNRRILRHTSPAFAEDPLRVLRGMQFAGRFSLTAAPETLTLCQSITHTHPELAVERVREEWFKWASRSVQPSAGLRFLRDAGWLAHFPEILNLIDTPQDPAWHPEGNVFEHTCHCCDALAQLPEWQESDEATRVALMLAILAHDFGKPETTHREMKGGVERIVSPGHEEAGGKLAESFLQRINAPLEIQKRVIPLVKNHLFYIQEPTDRAIRRLARRLAPETIEHLCLVMRADAMGRPPRPPETPRGVSALLEKAGNLQLTTSAPTPILQGRHLIECGLQPSKRFGEILAAAFEAQLEGAFHDLPGGFEWLSNAHQLHKPPPD